MRMIGSLAGAALFAMAAMLGCARSNVGQTSAVHAAGSTRPIASAPDAPASQPFVHPGNSSQSSLGFDRNEYPGDATMAAMRNTFAFTGYWLTNPPGETTNTWAGKRSLLRAQGWGFLLLANGRLDAEILKAQKGGTTPADLARKDAAIAVANAQHEGFPAHALLFLDQEEGGRLLAEQAAYLLGWTEAVAATGFRSGVYASGQQVEDDPGARIDTIEDVRARVKAGKLHEVAIFDALDQCPPAPGCTLKAKPLNGTPDADLVVWQYAQSPRRPEITKSCAATYAADGNCYAPGFPQVFLDMNVARSPDPSGGR